MGSPIVKAVIGALLVYALPIVTPHSTLPFGAALVLGWFDGKPPGWMAAEAVLALVAHDIAFFVGWRYFRKPEKSRLLLYIGVFPVLWAGINWAYLQAIPQYFLTDSASWEETGDWAQARLLEGYALADVETPPDLSMELAGSAVLMDTETLEMALLAMPEGRVEPLGLRWSNGDPTIHGVTAAGAALYREGGEWRVLPAPAAPSVTLEAPAGADHPDPALSGDGLWVGWIAKGPRAVLTPVDGGEPRTIDLAPFAPGSFRMDSLDMARDSLIVARGETEFLTLRLDGSEKAPSWTAPNVKAWAGTVRRGAGGWLAWDAYQEDDPYRVEWSLPAGDGLHAARKGYRIRMAALAPSGRYLAVSEEGRYNFDAPEAVYVLDAASGETVFLRAHPRFTRSRVAFLGEDFFAYDNAEGVCVMRIE